MKLPSQKLGKFNFPTDYDVIRTATLNKTDLAGGNNKFYQLEAHVSKDKTKFRLYSRYGRVGQSGMEEERIPKQDEPSLLAAFESLKKEKTGASKGYTEVQLASVKVGSSVAKTQILSDDVKKDKVQTDKKKSDFKVHESVEKLVSRLYTEAGTAVRNQLSGSLNSTSENPLGTLTLTQIEKGRKTLQDIQELIKKKPNLEGSINADIIDLSNAFYSAIPQKLEHRPTSESALKVWLKKMVVNDAVKLDEKEELLKLLSDVQGMVSGFSSDDLETKYNEIGCIYHYLTKDDDKFKKVEEYVNGSRSDKHSWKVEVKNIWEMKVKGQVDRHGPTMNKIGNVKALFHGSRSCNILGICKSGLLLRPPGVYVTGSMFGNGLYFADQSSKSEQYCWGWGGGYQQDPTYFMFVADVALGKIKGYQNAQSHLNKAPDGYDSVQGEKGYLAHNEFIIYDIRQHVLNYLVEFKPKGR